MCLCRSVVVCRKILEVGTGGSREGITRSHVTVLMVAKHAVWLNSTATVTT